jgi:hypothetical protein
MSKKLAKRRDKLVSAIESTGKRLGEETLPSFQPVKEVIDEAVKKEEQAEKSGTELTPEEKTANSYKMLKEVASWAIKAFQLYKLLEDD